MKKLITVILLFVFSQVNATTYYISTTGNNASAGTSTGTAWRTLAYAGAHTVAGDIIHVVAGNYTETAQCVLAAGVSIEGEGVTSNITYTYTGGACLSLTSGSDGTNGSQHISNIKLDGSSLTAKKAIYILARSNVKVFNCTIQNFLEDGILFKGAVGGGQPTTYATGNELYNCTITNNSDRSTGGQGNIVATGYRGMLIHDNVLNQTARATGHNGNTFSATTEGYSEGLKFYNNISTRNPDEGTEWSFHLELWDSQGGFEIYNNQFIGGDMAIDFGGNNLTKGTYTYGADVHDNLFKFNTPVTTAGSKQQLGVNIEGNSEYVYVRKNHFLNMPYGVQITLGHASVGTHNIKIEQNLFENTGFVNPEWGFDISFLTEGSGSYIDSVFIYNNTFPTNSLSALFTYTHNGDFVRNIYFINNIVRGVRDYGYITFAGEPGTKDKWNIKNNQLYLNSNSNSVQVQSGATLPSNWVYTGNFVGNPLWTSDFHLLPTSPAIDAGIDVGLPKYGAHPDLGAFEYNPGVLSLYLIHLAKVGEKELDWTYNDKHYKYIIK